MEIYICYDSDIKEIKESDFPSFSFSFIDERTFKGKKQGRKIRGHFAAHKLPFIGIYQDGKAVKGLYSEADKDVINSLIEYLHRKNVLLKN